MAARAERDWKLPAAYPPCAERPRPARGPAGEPINGEAALDWRPSGAVGARVRVRGWSIPVEKAWCARLNTDIPTAAAHARAEGADDEEGSEGEAPSEKKESRWKSQHQCRSLSPRIEKWPQPPRRLATPPKAGKPPMEATVADADFAAAGAANSDLVRRSMEKSPPSRGAAVRVELDGELVSRQASSPDPPPPPGMSVIEQWAVMKLVADIARLEVNHLPRVRDKEDEENASKKGGKRSRKPAAFRRKRAPLRRHVSTVFAAARLPRRRRGIRSFSLSLSLSGEFCRSRQSPWVAPPPPLRCTPAAPPAQRWQTPDSRVLDAAQGEPRAPWRPEHRPSSRHPTCNGATLAHGEVVGGRHQGGGFQVCRLREEAADGNREHGRARAVVPGLCESRG